MKLANELLSLRRVLALGVVGLMITANFLPNGILLAVAAWLCFLLLLMVYLFDVAYHSADEAESVNKFRILLRLFYKGLITQKYSDVTDVKGYYTNEQYDWITDVKFPEKILHDRRRDNTARKALAYIEGSKVLDLGCGTGLITQTLPGKVTGVDISPWKVERAQHHCPNATFLVGDAEDLSKLLSDNSFEAVVCTDVLEHLEAPHKAISEVWRVLKDKGIFIGTVPSKSIVWRFRRYLTTSNISGEPFHRYYNKKQLQKLLEPFKVLEIVHQSLRLEIFFAVIKEGTPE